MTTSTQQTKGTIRDAIALVSSAERGDNAAVTAMLAAYNSPGTTDRERGVLAGALLSVAVLILRTAASVGLPPESILGSVAVAVEDATA
jgi:hypothetical protein